TGCPFHIGCRNAAQTRHYATITAPMQDVSQYQYVRQFAPRISIPLNADVGCVRYYRCAPKPAPKPSMEPIPPKVELKYIPPAMRRPTPWSGFLSEWLNACEAQPRKQPQSDNDDLDDSCSSSSGACSGGTATTDFSSVSSPRKTQQTRRLDLPAHPRPAHQQQVPVHPPKYPYRVPTAAPSSQKLSLGQWAELLQLQQAAIRAKQNHPPPKLLSIHTAYLPELDAAVREMMGKAKPGQPWKQTAAGRFDSGERRSSGRGISSASDSAHGSDGKDQVWCAYCYNHAVHVANGRPGAHLPHVCEKGYWRGHELRQGATIVCPRLLRRICPLCGATGQAAHLTNYCPATKKAISRY
ncbi:hypothetical protein PMAYCL1PPCAC_20348, partial [Pristionchus mayeri]